MRDKLVELRKHKGMTPEQAEATLENVLYFATMLVQMGEADGMVAGAVSSTSNVIRPALQILKTAPGTKLVSAFFLIVVPDCEYGANGAFIFADSGLNESLMPINSEIANPRQTLSSCSSKRNLMWQCFPIQQRFSFQ